jgi:hypothetical protein
LVHGFERVILVVAEVLHQAPEVLEILCGGLEEDALVALALEEAGQAGDGDAAGVGLGGGLDEVGFYAAVDRDGSLGGVRDGRVGPLGQEAAFGQLVQKGGRSRFSL